MRQLATHRFAPKAATPTTFGDLMDRAIQVLYTDQTAEHAARRMSEFDVDLVVVCSRSGAFAGVVRERDIITRVVAKRRAAELCSLSEIMRRDVATARDSEIAARITGSDARVVIVVDAAGRPCGVVRHDAWSRRRTRDAGNRGEEPPTAERGAPMAIGAASDRV